MFGVEAIHGSTQHALRSIGVNMSKAIIISRPMTASEVQALVAAGRLVVGITDKGIHTGTPRIMLVSPSGSQCKSLPVTVDSPPAPADAYRAPEVVAELAAEKASRKARKARKGKGKGKAVVVQQTASPAPSKTESKRAMSLRDGEHHFAFYARAIEDGYTRKQAAKIYKDLRSAQSKTASKPAQAKQPNIVDAPPVPSDADGASDTDKRTTRRQARKQAQASLHGEATSLSDSVKRNAAILAAIAERLGL